MATSQHLRLEFVTPARALVHEDVDEVQLPGEEGYFGVLPGHAPMLAALKVGPMWYRKGAEKHFAFLDGGFAEILPDRVSILAQVAERAGDIDRARAEASKGRAEERLVQPGVTSLDIARARASLLRAIARLDVARQGQLRS